MISLQQLFICYTTLMLLAIAVLIALYSSPELRKKIGTKYSFVTVVCWIAIIGGVIGIVFTASPALFSIALFLALIILVMLLVLRILATATLVPHKRTQQQALLWSMAIATEKMIPLVPTIEAFARGRRGSMAVKARKLAKLLDSGMPLPEAIDRVPGVLPARVLPMIRVGYESGDLAKALRQAVQTRDLFALVWNSVFTKLIYIVLVVTFIMGILSFMFLKIVPSYEKIFKDFGDKLPEITRTLIGISHFIINFWFVFAPFYLLLVGLLIYLTNAYMGWNSFFYLPGTTRLMRRRHAAVILDSLALAAECNQPLGGGVLTLAGTYPQAGIRKKLSYVGVDIHRGANWCESLRRHGLIKQADQAVLQAAERVGNLPWAMREMADSNRRRLAYRLNALVQLAYPPIILCLGAVVMFVVVAFFYPVIALIMSLV